MYYSHTDKEFNYTSSRVFPTNPDSDSKVLIARGYPWHYDPHRYPDNSTLIAKVFANGEPVIEGGYTVGAFVGDECRGVCKFLDNLIYLNIHGHLGENDIIHFRAYENASGNVFDINETLAFGEQHTGTLTQPFALHFEGETGISETSAFKYIIHPRPLHDRMYIQGDTERIKTIKIITSDGAIVLQKDGYYDEGIDVNSLKPGVYIAAIITDSGKVYYEKVLKVIN